MKQTKELPSVEQAYENRSARAAELKKQGEKLIGYFCTHVPVEMLTAAGLVPFRITGDAAEPISKADTNLETIMCSFIRSAFDLALKGRYNFLDGMVGVHTCDATFRIYDIWRYYIKTSYNHFVNLPHMVDPTSFEFFEAELETFKRSLEKFTGIELSNQRLNSAIKAHNENRALIRELYELSKQDPPLISGVEVKKVEVMAMSLPVAEASQLVREVIKEAKERSNGVPKHPARLLVYGDAIDGPSLIEIIEESGANVVVDASCVGTRHYWYDVEVSDNPLAALARRYLGDIPCPRTFRPRKPASHKEDIDNRFGFLRDLARDFGANGAVVYVIRFCDTHELDVPDVLEYLEANGLPALHIEDEYTMASPARLKTRVQAFLEMIS